MERQTILIAEDDPQLRQSIGRFLAKQGYHVLSAQDAYQAVELALKDEPDLLLLDVHLPAGDGFSVHERLSRHPDLSLKPVIYMTHDPSRQIEVHAAHDGAFALLHKPFAMAELLETIQEALPPLQDAA